MDQEQKTRERSFIRELILDWRPTREQVLWTIRIAIALSVLLIVIALARLLYSGPIIPLVQLLVTASIPVVLAVVANRYTQERAHDDALQAYLDHMSELLAPKKDQPSLYNARPGDSLSTLARARTLTVLPRLDGGRKGPVVQFLYEAGLINKDHLVLDLTGADLREAKLDHTNLQEANLQEANLGGASLSWAGLNGAKLGNAYLTKANLSRANLLWADLRGAQLREAYLLETNLSANLSGADLSGANLTRANLTDATLDGLANLSGANLNGAKLDRANLNGANLTDAQVTEKQLAEANSLIYATMPNGQKYEDWLKDKKGRGEDGENSGPS